jgi:Family of unknown function (DUF6433)
MNRTLSIGEILDLLKSAKNKQERVQILQSHGSDSFKKFLYLAFAPDCKMDLPEGTPPHTPLNKPDGFGDATISSSIRSYYVFFAKSAPKIDKNKRESMFINLLETLDQKEAAYLIAAKDKKLNVGVTRKLVDEVFPNLIPKQSVTKVGGVDESTQGAQGIS